MSQKEGEELRLHGENVNVAAAEQGRREGKAGQGNGFWGYRVGRRCGSEKAQQQASVHERERKFLKTQGSLTPAAACQEGKGSWRVGSLPEAHPMPAS